MNKNSIGLHKFSRFFSGDDAVRFLCTPRADCNDAAAVAEGKDKPFASTRSVQIATRACSYFSISRWLCLHTLRADCNRSQHHAGQLHPAFASTRSVQIATTRSARTSPDVPLCLHTLRADCNGRNAQNCNIHFFRTCVELVDSFSVLNKSMLR